MTSRLRFRVPAALAALALSSLPAFAQTSSPELDALRRELEALRAGQDAIRRDLQEIKQQLQQRTAAAPAAPQNVVLDLAGDPAKGRPDAPLTLVEFSDYQCPFCAKTARETFPAVEKAYVETGKVRYVFRDFPLSMHRYAFKAAEAANCAGEQGKYWEMHDRLFENVGALEPEKLPGYAQAAGLDPAKFEECLGSGRHAEEIRADMEDGRKAGVRGTPTLMIGTTEPGSTRLAVVEILRGAQSQESLQAALDRLLAAKR